MRWACWLVDTSKEERPRITQIIHLDADGENEARVLLFQHFKKTTFIPEGVTYRTILGMGVMRVRNLDKEKMRGWMSEREIKEVFSHYPPVDPATTYEGRTLKDLRERAAASQALEEEE